MRNFVRGKARGGEKAECTGLRMTLMIGFSRRVPDIPLPGARVAAGLNHFFVRFRTLSRKRREQVGLSALILLYLPTEPGVPACRSGLIRSVVPRLLIQLVS